MTKLSGAARRSAAGLVLLLGLVGAVAPSVGAAEGPVFHESSAPHPLGVPSATRFPMTVGGTYVPVPMACGAEKRILWYAPGAAGDVLWRKVTEPATGTVGHMDVAVSVSGTYEPLAGDFDGDGCGDILWYGAGATADSVWYFAPDGSHVSTSVAVGGTYEPFVGDLDADGRTDEVFWYGPGSTAETVWVATRGAGGTVERGAFTSAAAPQVGGTFSPMLDARSRSVVWYAPGTAQDYVWTDLTAGSSSVTSVPARLDDVAAGRSIGGQPLLWNSATGTARLFTSVRAVPPSTASLVGVPGTLGPAAAVPSSTVRTGFTVVHQPGPGTDWLLDLNVVPNATSVSTSPGTAPDTASTCAVAGVSGLVHCWGHGYGAGGTDTVAPRTIVGVSGATQVAVGANFGCALLKGGSVYCWGDNTYSQLGRGLTGARLPSSSTASNVRGLTGAVEIGAGNHFACARTAVDVRCWGRNEFGQSGSGLGTAVLTAPTDVDDPSGTSPLAASSSLAVGPEHACAVSRGAAYCWGRGSSGQLGNGTAPARAPLPVKVSKCRTLCGVEVYSQLAAGPTHTCALVNLAPYCWGSDSGGQLGNGAGVASSSRPVAVVGLPSDDRTAFLSVGSERSCSVLASSAIWCWGSNLTGALGTTGPGVAGLAPASVPLPFISVSLDPAAGPTVRVSVGGSHSCTVATNGGVTCWGQGDAGQLGRTLPDGRPDLVDHRRAAEVRYFGVFTLNSPVSPVPV